jgi:divalent metal cation (Fe/Co/Zn/Cd) transporter
LADPLIGLLITALILRIVWQSGKAIFTRLLDGVDPEVSDEIRHALRHTQGVRDVAEVRLRWSGHRLQAELNLCVDCQLSVTEGHAIAIEARHELLHQLPYLSNVTMHIDPEHLPGENHHSIADHAHGGLAHHSHR